jgi:hypothetical protein
MPTVSLIPPGVPERLERRLGIRIGDLRPLERQALVTAAVEGRVSNGRLQLLTNDHPADITKTLAGLVARNGLVQKGQKRWTYYVLPGSAEPILWGDADRSDVRPSTLDNGKVPSDKGASLLDSGLSLLDKAPSSLDSGSDSGRTVSEDAPLDSIQIAALRAQAFPRGFKQRLSFEEMDAAILNLCSRRPFTAAQLAQVLDRSAVYLRHRALGRMVAAGALAMRFPGNPTHPQQAYWTVHKDATA